MTTLLTPHFSLEELTNTTYDKYRKNNFESASKLMGKMYQLAGFAERIREIIGHPLLVTSGYRTNELNQAVGGSSTSQHLLAEAIDIVCPKLSTDQVFRKIILSDLKYEQIIIEENKAGSKWVHISIGSKKEQLRFNGYRYILIN